MSYFATVSGVDLAVTNLPGIVLVPIEQAQDYLLSLAPAISSLDGCPVFHCDDGKTGTSHEFMVDAEDFMREHGTLDGSPIDSLLTLCENSGAILRVWWADDSPSHVRCIECTNRADLELLLMRQEQPPGWHFRYRHVPGAV